ncbi:helix-turn-helix transcriptional regulator [Dyella sp. 2HG41-7]|uniref:helix-turn-helix domain-containing protein n=1 Tax=Dyella sp. 2HG41-7 TaxID=2883239 RepID=UPI001F1D8787|nr:helix-turn-helix transcriptional regulator [Dyella sp. 2HG41-7]
MTFRIQSQFDAYSLTGTYWPTGGTESGSIGSSEIEPVAVAVPPAIESRSIVPQSVESLRDSDGFISGDDLMASLELMPEEEADANRWVGEAFYGDKLVTIKSLRLSAGLSQSQLAEKMFTSQSHISRIESGTENISWDVAIKLKNGLSVDMNLLEVALENQRAR